MKYLSLILSVLVLLLSTMPALVEDKCLVTDSNIECVDYCLDDSSHSQDDCTDCCSPFLQCNTCTGFPSSNFNNGIEPNLMHNTTKKLDTYKANIPSVFQSKIWEPPRLS